MHILQIGDSRAGAFKWEKDEKFEITLFSKGGLKMDELKKVDWSFTRHGPIPHFYFSYIIIFIFQCDMTHRAKLGRHVTLKPNQDMSINHLAGDAELITEHIHTLHPNTTIIWTIPVGPSYHKMAQNHEMVQAWHMSQATAQRDLKQSLRAKDLVVFDLWKSMGGSDYSRIPTNPDYTRDGYHPKPRAVQEYNRQMRLFLLNRELLQKAKTHNPTPLRINPAFNVISQVKPLTQELSFTEPEEVEMEAVGPDDHSALPTFPPTNQTAKRRLRRQAAANRAANLAASQQIVHVHPNTLPLLALSPIYLSHTHLSPTYLLPPTHSPAPPQVYTQHLPQPPPQIDTPLIATPHPIPHMEYGIWNTYALLGPVTYIPVPLSST